jgi:dihydroneopterin aldolase
MNQDERDARTTIRFAIRGAIISHHLDTKVPADSIERVVNDVADELFSPVYAWVWAVMADAINKHSHK